MSKRRRRTTFRNPYPNAMGLTAGVVGLGVGSMVAGSMPASPALTAAMPAFNTLGSVYPAIGTIQGGKAAMKAMKKWK